MVAVDVNLGEHREVNVEVFRDEGADLGRRTRLLGPELVAREPQNLKAVVVVMKRTQTCVLRGKASSRGDVDDEARRPREIAEGNQVAFQ